MYIKSIRYEEFKFKPASWEVEKIEFGQINLIVGKNSSGKSRVINIIHALASQLAGRVGIFSTGNWQARFVREVGASKEKQDYHLHIEDGVIQNEFFRIKSETILSRDETGGGFIVKKNGAKVNYKVDSNQLMAVVRSDPIQHPQFAALQSWAKGACIYRFGSEFGKSNFTGGSTVPDDPAMKLECSVMSDNVSGVFMNTAGKFKEEYKRLVIEGMGEIGYQIDDIQLAPVAEFNFSGMVPMAIAVKEAGVRCFVNQASLSQGMYRALALLIQFYANILWTRHACAGRDLQLGDSPLILIDDIGEGLDHERSRRLIGLLVEESKKYNIQIIMSSNDRYVMNYVPLEHWTVLSRKGAIVSSINYENSKDIFDEFSYSGLSNFDFFSGDHYIKEDS